MFQLKIPDENSFDSDLYVFREEKFKKNILKQSVLIMF